MRSKLWDVGHTGRGFELIEFHDKSGAKCELQQSSLAEHVVPGSSAVWLGLAGDNPKIHPVSGTSLGMRMHLDLEQVKILVAHLRQWLKMGIF